MRDASFLPGTQNPQRNGKGSTPTGETESGRRARLITFPVAGARLAVMSREVGQSGDWWLASDGGAGAVMFVEVEPVRQGGVALPG